MPEAFDPYYTWLAIPPEEQPADHYRLLGVRRFETNDEAIQNAYYQRMAYVRSLQTGPRMADSQRILNELSAAKLCLLNETSKAAYDQQLKAKLAEAAPAAVLPVAAPMAQPAPPPIPGAPVVTSPPSVSQPTVSPPPAPGNAAPIATPGGLPIVVATAPTKSYTPTSGRTAGLSPQRSSAPWLLLGASVLGIALLAVVVAAFLAAKLFGRSEKSVVQARPHSNPTRIASADSSAGDSNSKSAATSQGGDFAESQVGSTNFNPAATPRDGASGGVSASPVAPRFRGSALRCEGGKFAIVSGLNGLATPADSDWTIELWCRWFASGSGIDLIGCLPIDGKNSPTQSPRKDRSRGWGLHLVEMGDSNPQPFMQLVWDLPDRRTMQPAPLASFDAATPLPWRHVTLAYRSGENAGDEEPIATMLLAIDGKLVSVSKESRRVTSDADENGEGEASNDAELYLGAPGGEQPNGQYVDIRQVRLSKGLRYNISRPFTPAEELRADAQTLALFDFTKRRAALVRDSSGNDAASSGRVARLQGARYIDESGRRISPPMTLKAPRVASSEGGPGGQTPMPKPTPDQDPNREQNAEQNTDQGAGEVKVALASQGVALRFNGRQHVDLSNTQEVASWKSPFTAEMWVRWSQREPNHTLLGTLTQRGKHPAYDGDDGWTLGANVSGDRYRFEQRAADSNDRGGVYGAAANARAMSEGWHHVAYCFDGAKATAFGDGKPAPFPTRPLGEVDAVAGLSLGAPPYSNPDHRFFGDIRAFRLSSGARYSGPFTPEPDFTADETTLCLLDFSRVDKSIVRDLSGNGRDGKLVGPRWVTFDSDADRGSFDAAFDADNARPAEKGRDLLSEIDLRKNVRSGAAEKTAAGITTSGQEIDWMIVPEEMPRQYVLEATIERLQGDEALTIGVPIGGRPSMVTIDGRTSQGPKSGLGAIDGATLADARLAEQHPGAVFSGALLRRGRRYELRLVVRDDGVTAILDQRVFLDWHGETKQLGLPSLVTPPNHKYPSLGAIKSQFRVSRLEYWPLADRPAKLVNTPVKRPAAAQIDLTAPRAPTPDDASRQQAEVKMRDVFQNELAAANKSALKVTLARKLLAAASDEDEQPAMRFVLLEHAQNLAEQAGHADLAMEAAFQRASQFEIDIWRTRIDALRKTSATANLPFEKKRLAEAALALCDEAVAKNEFEQASTIADLAAGAASGAGDGNLRKTARETSAQAKRWKDLAQLSKQAAERLAAEPQNVKANQARGEYYCLVERAWNEGLAHLAKGEGPLAESAQADLLASASAAASTDQVAAADGWMSAAAALSGREKTSALLRAQHWYQQAAPQIGGVEKTRVEQKLAEIAKLTEQ